MNTSQPLEAASSSAASTAGYVTAGLGLFVLALPVNSAIIWYENNVSENRRTLINKLISVMAGYNILTAANGSVFIVAWTSFAPLPGLLCTASLSCVIFFVVTMKGALTTIEGDGDAGAAKAAPAPA